jgi:hypothetical protein
MILTSFFIRWRLTVCFRLIGAKFKRYRILIAMLYILPTLAGNILLWKAPRDSKGALLTGLYIVSHPQSPSTKSS